MKKLNALALCAVMAPVFTLGIGTVFAAEQEKTAETHAGSGTLDMSDNESQNSEMDGSTSTPTAETHAGSGTLDMSENESQEPGDADQAAMSGDAEGALHADDLIGKDVQNRNDDATIGSISDLVLSEDGQIVSVIVGVGGFLGVGKKDVAIPWGEVERHLDEDGESYVISVDRDQQSLNDATAYDRSSLGSTSMN